MSNTFTQLVGTTATSSTTTYGNAFTTLTNNNSANAVAIGKAKVNNYQRYLLQKYFANERTLFFPTIGAQNLTLTGSPIVGATSATLTSVWNYASCNQLVNFSGSDQRLVKFINGSATITWSVGLNSSANTSISTIGVQNYNIPANISKIEALTVSIGQLQYSPTPVQTIEEWNLINTLPYTSDIPNYYFPYGGTVGIFPIPSSTGNVITINYKTRVSDMTFDDYSAGTITAMNPGGYTVTGLNTLWSTTGGYPLNTDITFLNLNLRVNPPNGDGLWYPIQSFQSDTSLTLLLPIVNAPNISSSNYVIGQLPILEEDFHDMLVWGPLMEYFSTVVKDKDAYNMYKDLYKEKLSMLDDYAGTKTVDVDLESEPQQVNPNLFIYNP